MELLGVTSDSNGWQIFSNSGEWFWLMMQCIVVLGTLIFLIRQIRLQNHSHVVGAFASFDARWKSPVMRHARACVCRSHKPDRCEVDYSAHQIGLYFEELAIFARRGIIDLEIVWELYSFEIEHYWPMLENCILSLRRESKGDESFFHHFEQLYADVQRIHRKKRVPGGKKTEQDIANFVRHELGMVAVYDTMPPENLSVEGLVRVPQPPVGPPKVGTVAPHSTEPKIKTTIAPAVRRAGKKRDDSDSEVISE